MRVPVGKIRPALPSSFFPVDLPPSCSTRVFHTLSRYGGMENPCLTFVTPTLLAGDRR